MSKHLFFALLLSFSAYSQEDISEERVVPIPGGMFFDALVSVGFLRGVNQSIGQKLPPTYHTTGGFRFGNTWLKGGPTERKGFHVIWARAEIGWEDDLLIVIAPLHIGISSVSGTYYDAMEVNFTAGAVFYQTSDLFSSKSYGGIELHPEMKFRKGRSNIGVGYNLGILPWHPSNAKLRHSISITWGWMRNK